MSAAVDLVGPIDFVNWDQESPDCPYDATPADRLAVAGWAADLETTYLGCGTRGDVASCPASLLSSASAHSSYLTDDGPIYFGYGEDVVDQAGHNVEHAVNLSALEGFVDPLAAGGAAQTRAASVCPSPAPADCLSTFNVCPAP